MAAIREYHVSLLLHAIACAIPQRGRFGEKWRNEVSDPDWRTPIGAIGDRPRLATPDWREKWRNGVSDPDWTDPDWTPIGAPIGALDPDWTPIGPDWTRLDGPRLNDWTDAD